MKSAFSVFLASLIACSLGMANVTPGLAEAFKKAIGIELPPPEAALQEHKNLRLQPDSAPAAVKPLGSACSLATL